MTRISPTAIVAVAILAISATQAGAQPLPQLPPVPVPAGNPVTEAKRVLGKALFWDEQLSSDDTVACGTCHRPAAGGADPRLAIHPGADGRTGTADDIVGSPGVVRRDADGNAIEDEVFGFGAQVTGRAAPSFFANLHAPQSFWDGRADATFTDPLNPASVLLADDAALESQAVGPILSSVEMASDGRTWDDVVAKLARVRPLRYADDVPADLAAAIAAAANYPALFAAAFGDDEITPARIAFAIATYERTLVPDQTPWDRFNAGDANAMTAQQVQGWNTFRGNAALCSRCHVPPLFTNNDFVNLGLRPAAEDEGRLAVSGLGEDFGDMKMPGLRNVGLRATLMHTGGITDIPDALDFYTQARGHAFFTEDLDTIPPNGTPLTAIRIAGNARAALIDFLSNALTDPRAAAETFPFDRPTLASELGDDVARCDEVARLGCIEESVPGASALAVVDVATDSGDRLDWKISRGGAASADAFGDPTSSDGMVVCAYGGDEADTLVFEGRAPAGSDWRSKSSGFTYSSSATTPDGIRKITLKNGTDGRSKLVIKGAGSELDSSPFGLPSMPTGAITVQLQSAAGGCWSAAWSNATALAGGGFSAR